MWWVALWVGVMLVGAAGVLASVNSARFGRRVARDADALAAASSGIAPPSRAQLSSLPAPVRRYVALAVGEQTRTIARVRLRHGGLFRPSLKGSWLPIRGEQYFNANPPGFVWWGRVRIAPGMWIDARDRSVNGAGSMLVTLESTITLSDSKGAELDQGALLRLLGEVAWFPTAFLDSRYIRWSPQDDRHATATLEVNRRSVSAQFAFGSDNLPSTFSAERYRDVGGRSVLTPFLGRLSDYRRVDGVLVPHRVIGAWIVDRETVEYVNFDVEHIAFDWNAAFS